MKKGKRRKDPVGGSEFFVRCAGGFEDVLGDELRALGLRRVRPQVGGCIFFGTRADAYRACLWSRVATRVQLVVARVAAADAESLYQGVRDIAWEVLVRPGATVAVDAHGENANLRNSRFTALKVKDALCDRLRAARGARPDVDAHDPDLSVNVAVHPQKATIYLNLSGASLHRRGYREEGVQTEAPLKETLAAGILLAAGWPELAAAGGVLVDPMCGSGTLAVEGSLMAAQVAPGLLRERWGFEGWLGHDAQAWERLCAEARAARREVPAGIVRAGDLSEGAVAIARANARRAGVGDILQPFVDDAANLGRHLRDLEGGCRGLLVCNPPYGERLLSHAELPAVYAALETAVEALPAAWQVALITPDRGIDTALGRTPVRTLPCHNGPIATTVRLYDAGPAARLTHEVVSLSGVSHEVGIAETNSAQFAARLRKVARERSRWARRVGVGCWRAYDADLPDYALSVDVWQGAGADEGRRAVVAEERRRPASVDVERAERRLADAAALAGAVFDVEASDVVVLPWRDRRTETRAPEAHRYLTAGEGGCRFPVDLAHHDTGLPLWQRGVRDLAASLGADARVAALFATSAAALVRASAAGARNGVVVDGAQGWLEGAERLLRANDLAERSWRTSCADVRAWVARAIKARRTFDLVLCVAPSWLSARDAGGAEWELSRDAQGLVERASRLLSPGGTLLFACDDPTLRLDGEALVRLGFAVQDESAAVVPHDFERARPLVSCWTVRRA